MNITVNGKSIRLEVFPIHEISPYENNVRIHPVRQLSGLAHSIESFGLKSVIVIDKNKTIIAGHARYEAAASLGMSEMLCLMADDLNDDMVNAYRILDNKIAEQGGTDIQALEIELKKLPDFDFTPFNIEILPIKISEQKEAEIEDDIKLIKCPACHHEFEKR